MSKVQILSSNGEITLQYQNFQNSFDTQSATVGIENADGSDGLLIVLNTNYLHDRLAVKILSPEIGWLSVNPSSSTLPVGASVNVTVTFNTLGLLGGNYSANINVSAATPANLSVLVPVNLTVTEPRISVSPTQIDVGQVTFGTTLTQALNINNLAGTGGPALTFSIIESGFSVQADPSGLITPPTTGETAWDEDSQSQIPVYQRVNIPAAGQNLTPQSSTVNILWDDTHDNDGDDLFGNYFSFYDHLTGAGYNVVQLEVGAGPITSTTLSGYDIFVVVDPDLDFLTSEIDAVHDFVAQGGGLLIVGEPPQFNSQPTLDAILAPYGVQFTGGDFDDPAIGTFASHPITDGIQSVELGRHSSLNLSPPALALGFTNSGELVLGATEATGKVVVIADSSVMHNDWLPRADNLALMDNIFSWVITVGGEIPWLSVSPTAGAVEANGSLPITVSLNSTLSNGDYTAHLQIDHDDPSADPVSVQVKMTVIGASPEVATNPGSLDFGQVFTGEAMKKSLTVSNAGFDLLTVTDITSDEVVFTAEPTVFNLSPGNEKVVEVTFGPTSAGSVSAALTIASNDPDGALSVPLTGEGVVPSAISVTPGGLSESLFTGGTAAQSFTIANIGGSDLTFQIEVSEIAGVSYPPGEPAVIIETKGSDAASRTGPPVAQGRGGPDAFGYTWIDSDETGGPTFDYIDISGSGTRVSGLSDDNFAGPFPIGFSFSFYGIDYTDFYIASNGFIGFGPTSGYTSLSNVEIANPNTPNNIICWLWDDLHPRDGSVYYQTIGTELVVQFVDYGEYNASGRVDAEIILSANGQIELQYASLRDSFETQSSTIGIENLDGSDGLQVALNTAYLHDGLAVRISSGPSWLDVGPPIGGTISLGGNVAIPVTFNAIGLFGGDYSADIEISSNDSASPLVIVPASLNVTGVPDVAVDSTSIDFGEVALGAKKTENLTVSNTGTDLLTLTAITIDSSSFTVNLTFPVSVAPGSDQVVEITYVSTSVGSVSATLTIESDDPDGSLSVSLNAQGVATPWGVSPPNLSESLLSAGISTQSLTISNSGGSDLNFQIEVSEAAGFGPIGTDISGEPRAIIETKGSDIASGTGPPVTQGKGGPDTFGYTWIDSDEVGGPVFDYIDVSGSGNVAAGFSDDNFLGPFPIGFIFNFYGVDYTEFYISSNGFIGFGPTGAYAANSNRAIPDSNTPNNVICWLWDDLHPTGGIVYYQTIGGSTLVVQFVSYGEYGASGRVDAEVILSADGRIKFQYASFRDGFDTKGSTIGIENLDGSDGLQVALNTNYLHDALAVLISSGPGWV